MDRIGIRNRGSWVLAPLAGMLVLLTGLVPTGTEARERIISFESDITIHEDAAMTVMETIAVEAEGRVIRRGIYRDFPTTYSTGRGTRVRVGFEVLDVTRNGHRERYRTESITNGVRVRIGKADRIIRPGKHVYVITYRTNRQLGFFDGFDELYWNVTGNGWGFEIGKASARIRLPKGARVANHAAYTGPKGATGKDFTYVLQDDESAFFETSRPLRPREGLTVAVSWPPGFVARPSGGEEVAWFFDDNSVLLASLLGLGMVLIYFIPVWKMVGRDPEEGTIVPRYTPPKGFSPAAARYVMRMGFDDKVFTSTISFIVQIWLTDRTQGGPSLHGRKGGSPQIVRPWQQRDRSRTNQPQEIASFPRSAKSLAPDRIRKNLFPPQHRLLPAWARPIGPRRGDPGHRWR